MVLLVTLNQISSFMGLRREFELRAISVLWVEKSINGFKRSGCGKTIMIFVNSDSVEPAILYCGNYIVDNGFWYLQDLNQFIG